tara:strand:- start:92 stop:622 length:531 start_codon:yes stop_codon:yes gene_type:complete
MKISFKIKLFIVAISFFISGHAPWGQHEVYRQMHMLIMCSKKDEGAFEFTKNLIVILDEYLPEAKARAARTRDAERLTNLLSTNQIPLAIISSNFLESLMRKDADLYKDLLEHSKTLYTFKDMHMITNHHFPEQHVVAIIESLDKASKEKHTSATFVKKVNLKINYDEVVIKKLKF